MVQSVRVYLDNVLTLGSAPLVQPGTVVSSIYFASIPAGVSVQMAIQQKNEFPVYDGQSFGFSCDEQNTGVWLVTSAAFPGQYITVVVGTGDGGVNVAAAR